MIIKVEKLAVMSTISYLIHISKYFP